MNRKRIAAILTALSLMVSGLPMTSVYAAELSEPVETETQEDNGKETPVEDAAEDDGENGADSARNENEAADEQKDDLDEADEQQNASDEAGVIQKNTDVAQAEELEVAESVKMAGSNGILYEDVAYLSARNVLAMDEEMQEIYRDLCDEVAASKEGGLEMQDIVFAVDENGDLYYSFYVPMIALEEIQADMLPDDEGSLTPQTEESEAEEKKEGETSEDGKNTEEENKDEETSEDGKDAEDEEKNEGETSEDGKNTEEENKDEEAADDGKDAIEEAQDGDVSEDDENAAEEKEQQDADSVEDGQRDVEEESHVTFEENLDLISEVEEETFEVIEPVRIENTIDLGYGSGTSDELSMDGIQFNSILPAESYFENQLTATQKKYYNAMKGKLLKGSNKVSFKESRYVSSSISGNVAHAMSALVLAYPDRMDWWAKPGGFSGKYKYKPGASIADYTFTFEKSRFYSGSLDSKARSQVQTVGIMAQQYAADNYPNAPVYGIVRYFDQWVCENGYYENLGTWNLPDYAQGSKALKNQGYSVKEINAIYNTYYKCHSAYGILLEGYGVCESYAKAMARLLDAVGIPNVYVVGNAGGGHAWNYVQMPNGKWYLLDSTWNDTTDPKHTTSNKTYLLVKDDSRTPTGGSFNNEASFKFPTRDSNNYSGSSTESVKLNKTSCNLQPKEKEQLTYTINGSGTYGKVSGVWSSSNAKVAKVDQKGNVTAVAAGTAKITFSAVGMSAQCTVNVDQIKAVKSAATNKTSESVSLGNTDKAKGSKSITLNVDMGASPHTAQWMIQQKMETAPVVTCSKKANKDVVTATAPKVTGNTITFTVTAVVDNGSSKVTVKFGGKTVTINVTAGMIITKNMFDITWPAGETAAGNMTYEYTGKAVKPTVKKKPDAVYKPVTFKTTYVNNVNAGTAKVVLTGTGKYGGVLEYPFTIKQINIKEADFSKALKSKVYNGGDNPPAATVKLGKKTLKANKDYEILYTGGTLKAQKPSGALPVGKYTVTIKGIGNYTGTVTQTQPYEVTQNTIAKVSVAGASSAKYTGLQMNPYTVKIGKNVLPTTDYTITWYQGQGKKQSATPIKRLPTAKGKYTAVIKVRGSNLTNTAKKTEIKKSFTIK